MTPRNELQLKSSRMIRLVALNQWGTYAGLLEGLPTQSMNKGTIKYASDTAVNEWDGEPYLIQPTEKPIEYPGEYPFGIPASIPGITCIARFHSYQTARDTTMDFSELTIVWFQSEFAFPIEKPILDHISTIHWEKHAGDYKW